MMDAQLRIYFLSVIDLFVHRLASCGLERRENCGCIHIYYEMMRINIGQFGYYNRMIIIMYIFHNFYG